MTGGTKIPGQRARFKAFNQSILSLSSTDSWLLCPLASILYHLTPGRWIRPEDSSPVNQVWDSFQTELDKEVHRVVL